MGPHAVLDMANAIHVERVQADFFCHRPGSWALGGGTLAKIAA
jgi:hypothetical protein